MPTVNISRDSHFVPRATLQRWSDDGVHVFAYRILVSSPKVPEWRRRPIRGLACHRDLYTVFNGGQERDDFEKWLANEYERPGLEAIEKLLSRSRVTPPDWHRIARFVAAQDVRTPLSFVESMQRWNHQVPEILERSIKNAVSRLEQAKARGEVVRQPEFEPNEFSSLLSVSVEPPSDPASDLALARAEVPAGRRLWIAQMRHLLTGVANELCRHRWSVAHPHGDNEWPLTDHPVLRLNYYKPGHYDFGGGWGNPGSEMMMAVSPRHLLYVQIGKKAANRLVFSREHTHLVQRLLVERAHRWVFAARPMEWVAGVRPRVVDPSALAAERRAWEEWHEDQLRSEVSLEQKPRLGAG